MAQPTNDRWWYYLGQTLMSLNRTDEAIEAFHRSARLDGWGEQAAWAVYTAAKVLVQQHRYREAEELAAFGLTRDASFPELPWLIGWCCFQRGAHVQAVQWSRMAISLGCFRGTGACRQRIAFRHTPAWFEAPYDVLRFAYRQLGRPKTAQRAEIQFQQAKEMRLHQESGLSSSTQVSS